MSLPPKSGRLRTGSFRPIGSSAGRQPGTATRLTTAMNPSASRSGGRVGNHLISGGALNAQLTVVDRPTTQQGLGTMKTGFRGPQRQVQDRTYYLGLIRAKNNELSAEISKLKKEVEVINEENSSYLSYEKRAETLAAEIRDLQGELGDYNTLVDKLTTDEDIQDVNYDYNDLRVQNEKEVKDIERLFEATKEKEKQISKLEKELSDEKELAESLINDMEPELKKKYSKMKDINENFVEAMEKNQQAIDELNSKVQILQEDLMKSPARQKAVQLYKRKDELEMQKESLTEELNSKESPEAERNRLLKQLKSDNQEIATFERQLNSLHNDCERQQDDLQQLEADIQESQSEGFLKYQKLKKKEAVIDEFIQNFEQNKQHEELAINRAQVNIVNLLEKISQNINRSSFNLPSGDQLEGMKENLNYKEGELKNSESTVTNISTENQKLQEDLQKVELLESKTHREISILKEKIAKMADELMTYRDMKGLKDKSECRKQKLLQDKAVLKMRTNQLRQLVEGLKAGYNQQTAEMADNETYTQLGNLEKKWQQLEQNNHTLKEYIGSKTAECDYEPIKTQVFFHVDKYNGQLQQMLSNTGL
ncbi:intraflagellar transport protein 74 homolog [Octopus sinensis]|nr:intraflagellar transport protein 74 homolog [Octopus sinensis]